MSPTKNISVNQVLNLIMKVVLNPSVFKSAHFKRCKSIMDYYNKKYENTDIPLTFKSKYDLINVLINKRIAKTSIDVIVTDITNSDKFEDDIISSMTEIYNNPIDKTELDETLEYIKNISTWYKFSEHVSKFKDLEILMESKDFVDINSLIETYGNILDQAQVEKITQDEEENVEDNTSIDVLDDNFDGLIESIEEQYNPQNRIASKFQQLNDILGGGFAKRRVYIFGGSSGSGKSTFLTSLFSGWVSTPHVSDERRSIYVLYTFENLVDETIIRLYCALTNKTQRQAYADRKNIGSVLKKIMNNNNSRLIIKYFPSGSFSTCDLKGSLKEIKKRYQNENIVAVAVDYLDIMRHDPNLKDYRFQLGNTATELKNVSIEFDVPVISLTQLNRSGYDSKADQTLTSVSESMQKINNVDFVGLLRSETIAPEEAKDISSCSVVNCFVGKNRDGAKDIKLTFHADFSKYSIWDNQVISPTYFNFKEAQKDVQKDEEIIYEDLEGLSL